MPPEQQARQTIGANPRSAGWLVQDRAEAHLHAGRDISVREFRLEEHPGFAYYLSFVDGCPVCVLEIEIERADAVLRTHERSCVPPRLPNVHANVAAVMRRRRRSGKDNL